MMRKLGVVWTIVLLSSLAGIASGGAAAGQAMARPSSGESMVRRQGPSTQTAEGADPVLLAAGDIADCRSPGDETTADLIRTLPGTIATLGDNVYRSGSAQQYTDCYDPTWGTEKARTRPAAGNHDYGTPDARGYFDYFGAAAGDRGEGYYSYDLGAWHVVTLNSQCWDPKADNPYLHECDPGSPQEQWLRADLAQHQSRCTLAVWHHPLFSSGIEARNDHVRPLFQALYENGVDLLLTGHDHGYERFAPMDAAGNRDGAAGVRQLVVGTGGKNHQQNRAAQPNSEVRNVTDFGVLEVQLRPTAYRWEFVAEGSRVLDAGANSCH